MVCEVNGVSGGGGEMLVVTEDGGRGCSRSNHRAQGMASEGLTLG